jgi:hypothetical protein
MTKRPALKWWARLGIASGRDLTNTRVADPKRRSLNRKLMRQKRAKLRQQEKLLEHPDDPIAESLISAHERRAQKIKEERSRLSGMVA